MLNPKAEKRYTAEKEYPKWGPAFDNPLNQYEIARNEVLKRVNALRELKKKFQQ